MDSRSLHRSICDNTNLIYDQSIAAPLVLIAYLRHRSLLIARRIPVLPHRSSYTSIPSQCCISTINRCNRPVKARHCTHHRDRPSAPSSQFIPPVFLVQTFHLHRICPSFGSTPVSVSLFGTVTSVGPTSPSGTLQEHPSTSVLTLHPCRVVVPLSFGLDFQIVCFVIEFFISILHFNSYDINLQSVTVLCSLLPPAP